MTFNQHYYKYVQSCSECQQVTLKEPHYFILHIPIPQVPIPFISMDILGHSHETEKETNMF